MTDYPVAIVTGAGSGIGLETSLMLAEAGYHVTLVGRRREPLEAAAAAIDAAGGPETILARADLADGRKTGLVIDPTLERWGRVDVLVNNAAYCAPISSMDQVTDEQIEQTFAINVYAPARLIAALWPVFIRQREGCVVNISSMATVDPFPGLSVYAASKAALESLTRSVVNEGRGFRIRGYSVVPGAVETPMLRQLWSEEDLPREQALPPSDVAQVVLDCVQGNREEDLGRTIQLQVSA